MASNALEMPTGIIRSENSARMSNGPEEYWSSERINALEQDAISCLRIAATCAAMTPFAAPLAVVTGVLGANKCVINLVGDFALSDEENAKLHEATLFLDPIGMQLAVWGSFIGPETAKEAARFGSITTSAYGMWSKGFDGVVDAYLRTGKLTEDIRKFSDRIDESWEEIRAKMHLFEQDDFGVDDSDDVDDFDEVDLSEPEYSEDLDFEEFEDGLDDHALDLPDPMPIDDEGTSF